MRLDILLATILTSLPAWAGQDHYQAIGFDQRDRWHTFADEPWWALVDLRDMLNIFHPLTIPKTGNAAGASREVTIPADWRPPFSLRFYCADDYFADRDKHKTGQPGTESFFDHRFKQVLIDDKLIWERDVVDDNVMGSPTEFEVDVTSYVQPGKPFKLTFRAFDKLSTDQRGEHDVWFRSGIWYAPGDGKTEEPPRFHTAVWFADAVIGEKQAVQSAPRGTRPNDEIVQARHRQRWPMPPRGVSMKWPAELKLVTPAPIPNTGFPITCGVPMPPGLLKNAGEISLTDKTDAVMPLQSTIGGYWPDGSIRHLIINTIAPAGTKNGDVFKLRPGSEKTARSDSSLQMERQGRALSIVTGRLRLKLGADPTRFIDEVAFARGAESVFSNLTFRMSVAGEKGPQRVEASWQDIELVEEGPVTTCVEWQGSIHSGPRHVGRFVFRLYMYAGLPTIQTQLRIINDVKNDQPLQIADLALTATIPGGIRPGTKVGVVDGDPIRSEGALSLHQEAPDRFTVNVNAGAPHEGKQAQGWIEALGPQSRIHAAVRWFWQQYPKALTARDDQLEIGLFTPTEKDPFYLPNFGESKRHDIWFTLTRDSAAATDPNPRRQSGAERHASSAPHSREGFRQPTTQAGLSPERSLALLADSPPRLFDGRWFCLSGAFAVLDPDWFEHQPKIAHWVEESYGDISSARVLNGQFGIRNFGDFPYGGQGQWMNGYWAMIGGSLYWGLASGDPRWIQRSCEISRHIADVDCVRVPPDRPDWREWDGVTCALGFDHSQHKDLAKWPAFQQGESLFLHYWMTGDPDSREAALANADYIIRNRSGLGSSEARSQARPMLTLLRAWQATADRKYLDAARQYLDLKSQTEHVIDWRRGAYIQPTYANWRCMTAGLDSMYAHNIYDYYRLTGDVNAARLVVAVADSVYAESMLPQDEGLGSFIFYVRYGRGSGYYTQMAMLFHMAYDLTGDLKFLRAGRAAFDRYLCYDDTTGKPSYQPFHNFGWLDPEFGGWQLEFKDIPTDPFPITRQTPDPDPANYR